LQVLFAEVKVKIFAGGFWQQLVYIFCKNHSFVLRSHYYFYALTSNPPNQQRSDLGSRVVVNLVVDFVAVAVNQIKLLKLVMSMVALV
jgi:hypothetical protein